MLNDTATLQEAFDLFRRDAQFDNFCPAVPLLKGKENVQIHRLLVDLGIYKNGKQMRQELSPYEKVCAGPLAIFIPESSTSYKDIPSWLFSKSRSYKILVKMAQILNVSLPTSVQQLTAMAVAHNSDKSLSEHTRILNFLIHKFSDVITRSFKAEKYTNACLLVISSISALGTSDYKAAALLNLLNAAPDTTDLICRLFSTTTIESTERQREVPAELFRPYNYTRSNLDRILVNVDDSYKLFIDNTETTLELLNNPRSVMVDIALDSMDNLTKHLTKLDNTLMLTEGSELVREAFIDYGKAIKVGELSVVAQSVRDIMAFEQPLPSFDSRAAEIHTLLDQGQYLEISEIAKQVDEARNKCSRAYLDLAEFVQSITLSVIESSKEIKTSDQTIQELEAQVSELTHLLEESSNEQTHLREKLKHLSKSSTEEINNADQRAYLDSSSIKLIEGRGTVQDVVSVIDAMYSHVVFLPLALEKAKLSPYTKTDKLFATMRGLCSDYYNEIISGKPDCEAMKLLSNYRANESEQTMSNKEMAKLRMHEVNGESVCFEQHVTLGVRRNANSTIQIFFRIIGETMYIAYIGEHLDVSST